jgi:hypothetical protein
MAADGFGGLADLLGCAKVALFARSSCRLSRGLSGAEVEGR